MKNNVIIMLWMYGISLFFVITTHSIKAISPATLYDNLDSFGLLNNVKNLSSKIEKTMQRLNNIKAAEPEYSALFMKLSEQHKLLKELILRLEKSLEQEESEDNLLNDQLQKLIEDGNKALESKPFLTEEQRKELEQEKQENLFKKLTHHFNRKHEKVPLTLYDVD